MTTPVAPITPVFLVTLRARLRACTDALMPFNCYMQLMQRW